jgi:hypothetical protein
MNTRSVTAQACGQACTAGPFRRNLLGLAVAHAVARSSLIALALCLCLRVSGQYAIDAGGVYSLRGSIGQADGGKMSGGGYTLNGGFFGIVATYPPLLRISYANGLVTVSWPSPSAGFNLEQSDSLTTPNWTSIAQSPTDNGTTKSLTVSVGPSKKFYRLKK